VHEAGDLIQAKLDVAQFPTLRDVLAKRGFATRGPVLFKSCGWAGWDLAAARTAVHSMVRT
jgi:ornithine cyclodeaminase